MRRRTRNIDASSFDMLLDTMCNTFGGIVFIALLLSIVGGTVSRQATEITAEGSISEVDDSAEYARLQQECERLQTTLAAIQAVEDARPSGPTTATSDRLAEVIANNSNLQDQLSTLASERKTLSNEASVLDRINREASLSQEGIAEKIARIKQDMARLRTESTKQLRLPHERDAYGMRNCFFAVSRRRFYAISDVSTLLPANAKRGYDKADVAVVSDTDKDLVELRSNAGQAIHSGCERQGKILEALKNCNKSKEIINFVVVNADSFDEFNYLKQVFAAAGFKYNWDPDDSHSLILSSSANPPRMQ